MSCLILDALTFTNSCGTPKYITVTDKSDTVIRDSVFIRDSVRVVDSIIYVQLPREKVMDIISQIDTSRLETSIAESIAYVDTNSLMIIHSLENKDTVISERVVYKDRVVTKEKVVYRDSLVMKEVPVEVEVEKTVYPTLFWFLLGFAILVIGGFIVKIILKIKSGGII